MTTKNPGPLSPEAMPDVCSSCLAGPGQGHDPDCNADRRPRVDGVLVCNCEWSTSLQARIRDIESQLAARTVAGELHRAWNEGRNAQHTRSFDNTGRAYLNAPVNPYPNPAPPEQAKESDNG